MENSMKLPQFEALPAPGLWQSLTGLLRPKEFECIQVEITSCCAGRCTYCPHTTQAGWQSRHMSPETFAALWPLMLRSSRVHLQGWGEPFLHPHFMEFTRLALRAGCRVSTTTCGLCMNEKLAEELVDSGVDIVAFSLTGTDAASNAARVNVPFDSVRNAVLTLQRVRKARQGVHLELHLAYLLLASQMSALNGLPKLMDDWALHAVVVSTLDYLPTSALAQEAFLPFEREKIEFARTVLHDIGTQIRQSGHDFYASLPMENPAPQCRERVHKTLYVSAKGDISPCVYLNVPSVPQDPRTTVFGSVAKEDPLHIWAREDYQAFRQAVHTDMPPSACVACPKRYEKSYDQD